LQKDILNKYHCFYERRFVCHKSLNLVVHDLPGEL
jgi:hypothetical protein